MIIGTNSLGSHYYDMFKGNFSTNKTKKPEKVTGLDGLYSLDTNHQIRKIPLDSILIYK